jgi:solute carrier family 25 carnitine/acylcarnitine transporter 20/29
MNNININNFKEYIAGGSAGLSQVIVGYPLDTIKTNLQNGFSNTKTLSFKQLMRGIKYPLSASIISNIAFFGNYDIIYKYTNSTWLSGAATGFIGSFILNPFEIRKVRQQFINQPEKLRIFQGIYGGLTYTISRETIGNAFYFSAYHFAHDNLGYHPFIAGGFAGINSWFWSYPLDVIKTRKQLDLSLNLYKIIHMGSLFNGLSIALIRGFIVNGSSFWVYDKFKKILD